MTAALLRQALIAGLPEVQSQDGGSPDPAHVYVPSAHAKALALDCSLVIGARGVGKTFWWEALRNGSVRNHLAGKVQSIANIDVGTGFGIGVSIDHAPDRDTFARLIAPDTGLSPYNVWRAVCARWIGRLLDQGAPQGDWMDTVRSVADNPETYARRLERADDLLGRQSRQGLLMFDALDRASNDWRTTDQIVRDLLRVVLDLRPYRHLHAKVFLRDDQFEGRGIKDFTDASKLLATRADLTWGSRDLHGLLWQYLINAPATKVGPSWRYLIDGPAAEVVPVLDLLRDIGCPADSNAPVREVPRRLRTDEDLQKTAFARLAGQYMGRDRRRGNTYTWVVSHLSDSRGRASPRSFLAAIRHAAVHSEETYQGHDSPLHYEAIKSGVRAASQIRVDEMAEDYPWIRHLMGPLKGMSVPCTFDDIVGRWTAAQVLDKDHYQGDRLPRNISIRGPRACGTTLRSSACFSGCATAGSICPICIVWALGSAGRAG
ncbi:hypothetical protein ACFQ4K_31320 [Tistrella bauzanensis]